ncbi:MAG: hypothetical protein KF680_10085 [Cryobacterium sp.]|nr:hypothetical protein [Cryobacterium sp.]
MRTSRILGLLSMVVLTSLTVGGCGVITPVESKTNTIARELSGMPGVLAVRGDFRELHPVQPRRSALWVDLDPAATEAEVLDILTAFNAVNLRTGVDRVNSILNLVIDHGTPLDTDRLTLDFDAPSAQELAGLARAWFDLREHFAGADVELLRHRFGQPGAGFELSVTMPEHFAVVDDLDAIRHVRDLFADIGPVMKIFEVDGRFTVERALPSESTLAIVESIVTTDGVISAQGQLWGDESIRLTATVSNESGLVDFALGVSPLMAEVVDLIPADAPAIRLSFRLGDSSDVAVYFDNEACKYYGEGLAGAESRKLLSYWARDGRTLRDGSTAASCAS